MGNDAPGAVFDSAFDRKIAAARQQIKRTPAEETGRPFVKFMTGEKEAIRMRKIFVVHASPPDVCAGLVSVFSFDSAEK
jgi:hypothetical protein